MRGLYREQTTTHEVVFFGSCSTPLYTPRLLAPSNPLLHHHFCCGEQRASSSPFTHVLTCSMPVMGLWSLPLLCLLVLGQHSLVNAAVADAEVPFTDAQQQILGTEPNVEPTSSRPKSTVLGGMAVTFGRPDWGLGFNGAPETVSACTQQVQRIAARYGLQTRTAR